MEPDALELTASPETLHERLEALTRHYDEELAKRDAAIAERESTIERLREQINLLLARRFGASAEKVAEAADDEEEEAPTTEVPAHRRGRPTRKPLPEHPPRVDIEHALPEAERMCPEHGVALERFGEETSEQLDIIPAKVQVLRHIRGKYRCPCCEGRLRTAPMTPQPIPKSQASPGLLAYIATAKFVDAMPLYRQHQQLARIGFEVSRTTLATWKVRIGQLVQPLINLMRERMLESGYLLMDETTVQVLKEPGKTPESKSYLWAQTSITADAPVVLFDYDRTGSGDVPKCLLEGFDGVLQTDGYAGYDAVVRTLALIHLYCWAHARRRFVDVLKALGLNPKRHPPKLPPKAQRASKALGFIKNLYAIEHRIRDRSPEERYRICRAESLPVLDEFRAWLDKTPPKSLPSGTLGEALACLDRHWAGLVRYCDDGRFAMDTNLIENAIRPFVSEGAAGCSVTPSPAPTRAPISTRWSRRQSPMISSPMPTSGTCSPSHRVRRLSKTSRSSCLGPMLARA